MGFRKGDRVSWNTSQGDTHGSVQERRVRDFPCYVVESEKTGAKAAHKESALRKRT